MRTVRPTDTLKQPEKYHQGTLYRCHTEILLQTYTGRLVVPHRHTAEIVSLKLARTYVIVGLCVRPRMQQQHSCSQQHNESHVKSRLLYTKNLEGGNVSHTYRRWIIPTQYRTCHSNVDCTTPTQQNLLPRNTK
eukprot:Blabericola_migrator_1__2283@NODE_1630_length_4139_cov_65_354371_g1062_i0_p3_GENE_NODE_1630_length_4139_cov_65_354371_g1062_i0NODE_1630_length_4139_cov_65_354371_g1062_i0_p3_ORF_typecomplete_len134_score12_26_NODE_1630_length_4139_cov_65_354371_g1062_i030363437